MAAEMQVASRHGLIEALQANASTLPESAVTVLGGQMHCLTISPASSSGTATFPSMRSVDGGAATGFAARGGAGHRGRPREGSGAATEAWRGPAAACNQGVKSMAKDEARIIRASDVPLTRRPKFWPPEPFQMECP